MNLGNENSFMAVERSTLRDERFATSKCRALGVDVGKTKDKNDIGKNQTAPLTVTLCFCSLFLIFPLS